MSCRRVVVMGHPILRKKAEKVAEDKIQTPEVQSLIRDMIDTMIEYDGRGLAAPQIAESVQIVVMLWDFDIDSQSEILCLINPEIEVLEKKEESYWEGCLSLPGLRGKVSRPSKIRVKAFNENAEPIDKTIEGFAATVVQHECDHLQGVLYIDRVNDFSTMAYDREYRKYFALQ